MREKVTADRVEKFMKAVGRAGKRNARIYFVGGATAVLLGWRETTIDLDVKIIPDVDEILRALPRLKEDLKLNIELASPDDFIPPLPGWEERLYKYPAIDAKSFRAAVEEFLKKHSQR